MKPYDENIEFKSIQEYLDHWDEFFEEWSKSESHQKNLLENDKIWSKHKGTEWETEKGKKRSTKLEPDAFPQPYLGNIEHHSVITLNLNPSRSKKYGYENFNEPVLDSTYKYNQYAESFPTYDTHPFWKKQDGWIDSIFKKILVEEKLVEEKLYQYNPETKKEEKLRPFAIEICPWGSKSWRGLGIKKESKEINNLDISTIYFLKYLNNFVFDVIEKVIEHSKLKIILSVGKAYYDIFNNKKTDFERKEEISYKKNKPEGMDWPQTIDKKSGKDRDVKRTFSIWKKGKILYINTYASGSNTPPAEHFNEIQNELINKHLI